jgi:hypothetical protein
MCWDLVLVLVGYLNQFQLLVVYVMMCWPGLKPLSNKDFKG